ncbi:MAG: amidophosphoribosyltransferase [Anaerolineae bacterium]|nr:amidophosphoribosyltransferase [Anaerolineae bacterium]
MMDYDKPRHECGVFGAYTPGEQAARVAFFALHALQHRGQESAGICSSDGRIAHIHKAMGLVSNVFNEENLAPLKGEFAIGHTRYSTTGGAYLRNAQPYLIETLHGPLGVAHNGNLINAPQLRRDLLQRGIGLTSSSDSEVMTLMLAGAPGATMEERIAACMRQWYGAYSIVVLTPRAIYAARDPWGFRPLVWGRLPTGNGAGNGAGGLAVASESCALSTVGATYEGEVHQGEVVRLDASGFCRTQAVAPERGALCTFEHIYFARPDSIWDGHVIHHVRQQLGAQLARESHVDADVVCGVPDSATPAAMGYSRESGVPISEVLVKNRYIGRTFIQPSDRLRKSGVRLKFNVLAENIVGKRVILIDDSIVRGNTSGPIVKMVREAGATEIHLRITCPPITHPCYMGVDMATPDELIAHRMTVAQMREHIGCDTLAFLSLEGMMRAIGRAGGYCNACFTGRYPLPIEAVSDKQVFEGVFG